MAKEGFGAECESSLGFAGDRACLPMQETFKRHQLDPWVWKIPWRRARQPTPVLLPGESPFCSPGGLQSLGRKESDTTEAT